MPHLPLGNRIRPRGFTLIELLVVIAIIAILAVVVVLTLNPAQLLAQSRDANRISDMATLNSAITLYNTDQSGAPSYSLGTSPDTYISIPDPNASSTCGSLGLVSLAPSSTWACASTSTYRNASSSGWLPIAFNNISSGSPFGSLPVDPVNQTSSGFYYAYLPAPTSGSYEIAARLESTKYAAANGAGGADGGMSYQYLETGKDLTLIPTYAPKVLDRVSSTDYLALDTNGLVGYWPLNEGSGNTAYDQSGNGNNATGAIVWSMSGCKTGSTCLLFSSSPSYATIPFAPVQALTKNFTIANWVKPNTATFYSWPNSFGDNSHMGYAWRASSGTAAWYLEYATDYPTCSGSSYAGIGYSNNLTLGVWHYLVATYDGTTINIYEDGVLVSTGAGPANGNMCAPSVSNPLILGTNNSYPDTFSVNDVRFYNRVLSPAEIQEIYNAEK